MKIEVGEYVRTKSGIIAKATSNLYEYKDDYKQDFDNDILNDWYNDEKIVKHSKNIIDLIEAGDYVDGYIVEEVEDETIRAKRAKEGLPNLKRYYKECDGVFYLDVFDINSIVTKEQFSNIEYKVGD